MAIRVMAALSPVWRLANSTDPRRLTVLGYHDVVDPVQLSRQMAHVSENYTVLSQEEVGDWLGGDLHVRKPAWVTFDDGYPSVVESGMSVLDDHAVKATMFICPGVIEGDGLHWWERVEVAAAAGLVVGGTPVVSTDVFDLKTVDDSQRREWVARVQEALDGARTTINRAKLTVDHISRWLSAGHGVGNHTWDHPLLHMCTEDEQTAQITRAHEWIKARFATEVSVFAYPNGNSTAHAENVLERLEYDAAVLFDHRVARVDHPLRVSRVRVNSTDTLAEFIAKVSGVHPFVHRMLARQ